MAEEDSFAGGDADAEAALLTSASPSPSSSPKTTCKEKIKLRCSHGGKIMVRPPDGPLKYIGGETRVVAIPRRITFSELMRKLSGLVDGGEVVLKYQLVPEELDTLVSVRTDEDLKHMLEEYDRQEHGGGTPRMRAFLFPSKPVVVESVGPSLSSHVLEQRYIDAINGIVRSTPPSPLQLRTAPSSARPSFSISSPSSSPKVISPDKVQNPWDASNCLSPKRKLSSMHRVRSSPTLYNDGESHQQNGSGSQLGRQLGMYQGYRYQNQAHGHHHHQRRAGGLYSINSLQPQDFYRGVGRLEHGRGGLLFGHGTMDRFYPACGRPYKGNRGLFDEGSNTIDRSDSIGHTQTEFMWE